MGLFPDQSITVFTVLILLARMDEVQEEVLQLPGVGVGVGVSKMLKFYAQVFKIS